MCLVGLDASHFAYWFFGFVFCATASTIVSGAVAERCELAAYFAYSTAISALVYPVVVHWAWTPAGWLAVNGYYDFAGSGVVHHLGGVCALMGAVFLGPRIGRFDTPGRPAAQNIAGHSVSHAALGAFILMFGFLAFNGGTNAAVATQEDRDIVQRAVINTVIGGVSSGLATLVTFRVTRPPGAWSLLLTINGTLSGMIATCAFCNAAETWATFIVGMVAALVYALLHHAMIWFRIDDPLDAVAVHSGGKVVEGDDADTTRAAVFRRCDGRAGRTLRDRGGRRVPRGDERDGDAPDLVPAGGAAGHHRLGRLRLQPHLLHPQPQQQAAAAA